MKNAIIIHGTYGNPDENWFPWLKTELEKIGYKVYVPTFPTPENQNLKSWIGVIENYHIEFNKETIIIGHSVGASFILSILESLDSPIRAAFLVSGFLGLLGNEEFDNLNYTFTTKPLNWKKIQNNVGKIFIYHSNNDPYVPIEQARMLAKHLNVNPVIIENGGHFNKEAGYKEFPKLLLNIKNLDN